MIKELSDTVIILLGVLGGIMLLGGVAYSAYTRVKKISRSGMRLGDLLSNIEESLEEENGIGFKTKKSKDAEAEKPESEKSEEAPSEKDDAEKPG